LNRQDLIAKIIKFSARFVEEVKTYNELNLYDINIHAETFMIPVLNVLFDLKLENLNSTTKKNFPSIDLADFKNRVAFQITSTSTNQKIKETVIKFSNNKLYNSFDVLYIYILTEKEKHYQESVIKQLLPNKFSFKCNENIIDNTNVLQKINTLSVDKLDYLAKIYEHEFSDIQIESREKEFKSGYLINKEEKLYPNLLEIRFPENFYVAELNIDDEEVLKRINEWRIKNNSKPIKKLKKAWAVANQLHFNKVYRQDWLLRENKLYTFQDLYNRRGPFSGIIDKGTINTIKSREYYSIGEDNLKIFKNLLRNVLIQDCYSKKLGWVGSKSILRFRMNRDKLGPKAIQWRGKNKSNKTVIFEVKNKKDGHLICYRHLAFRPSFEVIEDCWFLVINPTWSFTNPGGHKTSRFEEDYLSGIKRIEGNISVYYFYRFWSYYLSYYDMFSDQNQTLTFKTFSPMLFTPKLDDTKWLPIRHIENNAEVNDSVIEMDNELSPNLFD
jgi:hypothetical protein